MAKPLTLWKDSELERQCPDHVFEGVARRRGYQYPAGIDEVGRGCLAGPVVAAAVILPRNVALPGVNDSKKLSPQIREHLYREILHKALACAVAFITAEEIDRINILQASFAAMRAALSKLTLAPDYILVDGRDHVPGVAIPQRPIIGGDGRSVSIAAASIVAKVTRDRMMRMYARRFPGYLFEQNKGYGTLAHRQALLALGPCDLHRRSFAGCEKGSESAALSV